MNFYTQIWVFLNESLFIVLFKKWLLNLFQYIWGKNDFMSQMLKIPFRDVLRHIKLFTDSFIYCHWLTLIQLIKAQVGSVF